jgi:hypothetical protein
MRGNELWVIVVIRYFVCAWHVDKKHLERTFNVVSMTVNHALRPTG